MGSILRLRLDWTGFSGAPGYTNLHFKQPDGSFWTTESAEQCVDKTDTWINTWNDKLPTGVLLMVNSTAEVVEETTGELLSFEAVTPFARASGTAAGNYSAASGAVVNWYTGGIRNGRRVRGRTFIVPLGNSAYDAQGTLADAVKNTATTAANALAVPTAAGGRLAVWARPTAPGAADGAAHFVVNARVPDKVAVLRSRRD